MAYLNKLLSTVKKLFRRTTVKKEFQPRRDWHILLGVGTFILIGILSLSSFLFFQITAGDFTPQEPTDVFTFDTVLLNTTLTAYVGRATHFEQLKTQGPSLPDPAK